MVQGFETYNFLISWKWCRKSFHLEIATFHILTVCFKSTITYYTRAQKVNGAYVSHGLWLLVADAQLIRSLYTWPWVVFK